MSKVIGVKYGVWAILVGLSGVLLTGRAHAQCTKDTDRKGARVCEQGQCVTAPPAEALPPPPPAPEAATPEPAPVKVADQAAVPAPAAPPRRARDTLDDEQEKPRNYHRRNPTLMTTGIVLTSSSLPFLMFTAYLSSEAHDRCIRDFSADRVNSGGQLDQLDDCQQARETRGYIILGTTAALLGVGIPLIVYGAKKVPNRAQATLTPWLSPTAAGATLRLSL